MKFYIYDAYDSEYKPLKVEIEPTLNEVLDETLDSVSLSLLPQYESAPYKPMTSIKVELEDSDSSVLYFCLIVDNVEIFSLKPLTYKHNLNLAQNTRLLSKQIVRNTKITQPASKYKESLVAISQGLNRNGGLTRQWYSGLYANREPLALDSREKVKNTWVRIDVQCAISNQNSPNTAEWAKNISTLNDINSQIVGSLSWNNNLVLYYTMGGVATSTTITTADLGGTLYFNRELACPKIANLINQGAKNIYLGTTQTTAFFETNINVFDVPFTASGMNVANGKTVAFIMCQIKIKAETYYYNCYDVLELLRLRQLQGTNIKTRAPLFNLPISGETYDLLKNTVAPEFTWTQNTLYECVADVFRLFDAIFTMDGNNTLEIEFFNDLDKEHINPRLVGKSVSLSEDKYFNGFVSYYQDARLVESFPSEKGYAPIRSQTLGILPDRADHFFIVEHPIHSIIDSHIGGFNTLVYNGYNEDTDSSAAQRLHQVTVSGNPPFEISHYIVEKSIWTTLDSVKNIYNLDPKLLKQNNTVFFERLDNKIQLAYTYSDAVNVDFFSLPGLLNCCGARMAGVYQLFSGGAQNVGWAPQYYGPSIPIWNDLYMNLKYISSLDGRLKVESIEHRLDGETIIDQSNGAVDLNKLGLNILGLSLKLGQPTLTATRKISSISKRIKKGAIYKDENNEIWIANSISYKVLKNGIIQENISFVKNFNMLSLRTQILREKRLSNISRDLTVKSEDNICDYLYLSSESKTNSLIQDVHFNKNYVYSAIKSTFVNSNLEKPTVAYIPLENYDKYVSEYMSQGTITSVGGGDYESYLVIRIPNLYLYYTKVVRVTKDGVHYPQASWNIGLDSISVLAEAQDERDFDHILVSISLYKRYPYIYLPLAKYGAGNALCFEMTYNSPISAGSQTISKSSDSWIGSTYPYFTQSVLYTDEYGFKDEINIKIVSTHDEFVLGRYFPNIAEPQGTNFININPYYVYKQPNEIFALNYEIVLLAVDYTVDFIGSKLVNENFLVTSETPINQELRLYYTTDSDDDSFQYSVLDTEGHEGHYTAITSVSQSGNAVTFNFAAITNLKTWAICDSKGKIYFASNRAFSGSKSSVVLYLYARNSRIE